MDTSVQTIFSRKIESIQRGVARAEATSRGMRLLFVATLLCLPATMGLAPWGENPSALLTNLVVMSVSVAIAVISSLWSGSLSELASRLEKQRLRWRTKGTTILWRYSTEEWERFTRERLAKVQRSAILVRTSLFAGGVLLWFVCNAFCSDWWMSGAITLPAIIGALAVAEWRRHLEIHDISRCEQIEAPFAMFGNSGVVFGDQLIYWNTHGRELREIDIECDSQVRLVLRIQSPGGKHPIQERIEILLPESVDATEALDRLTRVLKPHYAKPTREVLPYTFHDSIAQFEV